MVPLPAGAEVIPISGATLLPGLIDCHDHLALHGYGLMGRWELDEPRSLRHLRTARAMEQTLAMGYTTLRDAGWLDAGFKLAVEEGLIPGPPPGDRHQPHIRHGRPGGPRQSLGTSPATLLQP